MTSQARIGVVVADAHPVVRIGLQSILRDNPSLELLGMCGTAVEAVEQCGRLRPTVVVIDWARLSDTNGVEVCWALKRASPQTHVLVLTALDDDATVFGSIQAGASGYVLKDISPENLLRAIHAVCRGETMLHPRIARRMLEQFSHASKDQVGPGTRNGLLTGRETEVLVEIARGATNKEIARRLYVSESTVKSRLRTIFEKIGVRDRAQAAVYAIRGGYMR